VARVDDEFDRQRGKLIEDTLRAFGAPSRIVEVNRGPTITQFGVEPEFIESRGGRRKKVKVSKIASLADDLALALAAPSVRVEAPVPGKGFVGIEVPNTDISLVALRDVISGPAFEGIDSQLRMGLGQDVSGHPVVADLGEMPHLLIAGTTGSGKSVCVNAIIACLLLQNTPEQLQFIMVDPKRVELTNFNGIPHLLAPVIVDLDRVVPALQWLSREMDERYRRFSQQGVRHIDDYNRHMRETEGKELPLLVVMIDELADLMMLAPDETERVITRLAQLARATGIHLVISTQRPSVDVVTGLIKANFPARIAFAVASSVDSRVILDQPGAERLLGRGDMLFQAPDAPAPIRLQGSFVSDAEMQRLIRYWKRAASGGAVERPEDAATIGTVPSGVPLKQTPLWEEYDTPEEELDELFDEAVGIVREMRRGSISLLQRRLRIGYTRAARLIDQMEEREIVGPQKSGSQPREVLDYGEVLEASGEGTGGD
jgi:S-DNA-T family DNA segregation ATPase FtsK/SpoIIIE